MSKQKGEAKICLIARSRPTTLLCEMVQRRTFYCLAGISQSMEHRLAQQNGTPRSFTLASMHGIQGWGKNQPAHTFVAISKITFKNFIVNTRTE